MLVLPSMASAQTNTDPEVIAQQFVDDLISGDYEAAVSVFDADMVAAMPADVTQQTWETIVQQVGAYQEQTGIRSQPMEGDLTLVVITLQFEALALDTQIAVNTEGQIAGLYFVPAENAPAAEYEPPAYVDTNAFTEQDVIVGSGDWALPGTLTLPVGDGPFPAIVLVHGSGPNDRDETIGPNKPFRDLAWGLASQGIAVLRYDKRTRVYGSEIAQMTEFTVQQETVEDALAAVELLRSTENIDTSQIFVVGHSLGGLMIPQIASQDPDIAGVIVMAGPTRPLNTIMVEQIQYLANLDGDISADEQEAIDAVIAESAAVEADEPIENPQLFTGPLSYWTDLIAQNPVETALQTSQPMLILQGERDYQVTMDNFQGWQEGLAGRDNVTFIAYPDLNHLFMSGTGPSTPDEYDLPSHVADAVITDIVNWIEAH
jgi:dipeptidyl aminopeptidase/acylaminoacyl peptidase